MWLTLAEAKASALSDVASACATSALFLSYLNQAARQLLIRGSWENSVQKIRICSFSGCIVWPRWVELPLAFMSCNSQTQVKGNWFEFMPVDGGSIRNTLGSFGPNGGSAIAAVNQTYTPVQREITCCDGMYLRAYVSRNADIGKTFTIFGIDATGQPIRTVHPDGLFKEGVVITCANPFAGPSFKIKAITRVLKDVMEGTSWIYQYDPTTDKLADCGTYEPGETNPQYLRTITNAGQYALKDGSCSVQYTALVKMKFIPAVADTDVILVSNLDALKWMILSIKMGDAGDIQAKRQYEKDAIRELNLQLRNSQPTDQIPVSVNPFGSALPFGRYNQRNVF